MRTVLSRNLSDRAAIHIPIGAGVQIADQGKWQGEYRAIAHSAGNSIIGRGRQLLKWPKQKFRLSKQNDDGPFDHAVHPEIIEGEEDLLGDQVGDFDPYVLPGEDEPEPSRPSRDHPVDGEVPDDEYWISAVNDARMLSYPKIPFPTYHAGSLIISSHCLEEHGCPIDRNYFDPSIKSEAEIVPSSIGYYQQDPQASQAGKLDQQILDRFGPSRIPPRVAFAPRELELPLLKKLMISCRLMMVPIRQWCKSISTTHVMHRNHVCSRP